MKVFSAIAIAAMVAVTAVQAAILDSIRFGDRSSERSHGFAGPQTRVVETGDPAETARELLPLEPVSWQGGNMRFKMRVDPRRPNYVTVKLRGDDVNENMLILYVDGRQVGFRHFGDVDILDHGSASAAVPGRFYYVTVPIPMSVTYRKSRVEFEIAATGGIVADGADFEHYQKEMRTPSRRIYDFYVHDDGFFEPPAGERQGRPPEPVPPESGSGDELEAFKAAVNHRLALLLVPGREFRNQEELRTAAHAYRTAWTPTFGNPALAENLLAGVDALALRSAMDSAFVRNTVPGPESEWCAFGPAGEAVCLLWQEFEPRLNEHLELEDGRTLTRRQVWTAMFESGVKHLSTHRRPWADQSRIIDLNLHWNNRALRLLAPGKGLPPARTLHFLYESAGIEPWSGPVDAQGVSSWPFGRQLRFLTAKSLAKEFGDVRIRGDRLDWLAAACEATRPAPDKPGDGRLLETLRKAIRAESFFRYPAVDGQGRPLMRAESVIDWRSSDFPGEAAYVQLPAPGLSVLRAAAVAADPGAIGIVQQMFAQNRFFPWLARLTADGAGELTPGLLRLPEQYEFLRRQPAAGGGLPMSGEETELLFSDEENGVIAMKEGGEILYVSLYWRALRGVNFLARVHHITPEFERIATVREEVRFQPAGITWLRRNWTNSAAAAGGIAYPDRRDSVHLGETLPVAWIPDLTTFRPGQESPLAGRGDFYRLEFGPWLIGMNTTPDRVFHLELPEKGPRRRQIVTGREFPAGERVEVGPMSTVVLRQLR